MHARYSHTYAALPERFHAAVQPTAVRAPTLIAWNDALAAELGIDVTAIDAVQLARYCAGNEIPPGARPLAMAYAGHQFGSFVPQLGDGRALLLGEVVDVRGQRRDLQWKGAGQTPYSRRGDGRSALGPVLREYLVSEAMHALGIPSTRALAAVATGEHVLREDGPLPGGVLIRVAASHVRIGTFEYFAAREDVAGVRLLADHVIDRHYPDLRGHDEPYAALLQAVAGRQAALVARWLQVGFIHGVMNTDNMTVSGETIDFGPCAFMDEYDPATVFSYIDRRGRYAYGNQPHILQWNLARFAETLLPLLDADTGLAVERATAIVNGIPARFAQYWLDGFRRKLGLATAAPDDESLLHELLEAMQGSQADFTNTFRELAAVAEGHEPSNAGLRAWTERWLERAQREGRTGNTLASALRAANPAYIPRNHRVEAALSAAVGHGDFEPFHRLRRVLAMPYDDQPGAEEFAAPPATHERVRNTFCGT
jgi:serine/tyrosine/threonine adenylyltransferase